MNSTLLLLTAAAATNIILMGLALRRRRTHTRPRRLWSRSWLQRRRGRGVLNLLNNELLEEDLPSYRNFLRLSNSQFDELLALVQNDISKQNTFMREPVSARNRLEVTLRFLATGESYRSLMYSTRIHESTISRFVPEVCFAIHRNLKGQVLQIPQTIEAWTKIAEDFYSLWQFPNCLGALDGKHISFRAPISDGSYYYNYKGFHSIVLLAMCDAHYKFTYVNVGTNGRVSDGGVFHQSSLYKAINDPHNQLNFPPPQELPERQIKVPFVIIADDAFPLSTRLLKPYSLRGLTKDCKIYNYRLSRARRMIETSFGILVNRFRVLLNPIHLSAEKVERITLACVVLHNYIIKDNNARTDQQENYDIPLTCLGQQGSHNSSTEARGIRDEFKYFFNTNGAVPWQEQAIQRNNL